MIERVSGDQREYVADQGRALERYLLDLALEYKAFLEQPSARGRASEIASRVVRTTECAARRQPALGRHVPC